MKEDTEAVYGVAIYIKKDTKNIKEDVESLKEDMEIIKERQQNLEKGVTQIKDYVTKKPAEIIERNNLSYPEQSNLSELYLFGFCFALNMMNSGCDKFEVTIEQKNNPHSTMF